MWEYNYLRYSSELYHHGIKNQRWGVKNGPPYPLSEGQHSQSEKNYSVKRHSIPSDISLDPSTYPTVDVSKCEPRETSKFMYFFEVEMSDEQRNSDIIVKPIGNTTYIFDNTGEKPRLIAAEPIPDADTGLLERKPYEK